MTALDFANQRDFVVVRIAGVGCPGGEDFAWIPPETELPFNLESIDGEVREDGQFVATNLARAGSRGWRFSDFRGNTIWGVWLRVDPVAWQAQFGEVQ